MKYILSIFSLFFLLNTTLLAHDVPVANFDLSLDGDQVKMKITIDKGDFKKACAIKGNYKRLTEARQSEIVSNYLDEHLELTVNGEVLQLEIQSISTDHHHLVIEGVYLKVDLPIQSIVLANTCLVDVVEGHSNVITADLNGKVRGVRMDTKRRQIQLDY